MTNARKVRILKMLAFLSERAGYWTTEQDTARRDLARVAEIVADVPTEKRPVTKDQPPQREERPT